MKKLCFLWALLLACVTAAFCQPIIMTNTTQRQPIEEDTRFFYDPGGPDGDFGLGIRDTLTMRNVVTGPGMLMVEFIDFAMGYGDTLYIFDGQDCSGPLIGFYNSVFSPEQISTPSGFLTFVFHSDSIDDYGILKSGWMAKAYVVPATPEELFLTGQGSFLSTCNGKFYDSGGPTENMTTNSGTSWCNIFSPVSHVKLEFDYFEANGVLKIYDGNYNDTENRRLIGQFHTTTVDPDIGNKPPVLFSSGTVLSVEYESASGDRNKRGWSATVSCVPELFESPEGSACPKVVTEDELGVEMPDTIHHICGMPVILSAHVTATGQYTNDYTVRQLDVFNPPFPFNQGTLITADVDDNWVPYSNGQTEAISTILPFTFSFFGKSYTSVYPGANGIISFTNPNDTYCSWDSRTCPTSSNSPPFNGVPYLYKNCIYGVMEDIFPSHVQSGGAIRYGVMGDYPCRTFVFNYDNIGSYSCWSDGVYNSYQMVIYEGTNIIDVFIRHRQYCDDWNQGHGVVGLQNSTSSQMVIAPGRDFSNIGGDPSSHQCTSNCWTANNEAWRFTPITPMDEQATIEWFVNTVSPATSVGNTKRMVIDPQETTDYIVKYHFVNASDSLFDLYDTIHVIVDVPDLKLDTFEVCPGKTVTLRPTFGDTTDVHPQDYMWSTSQTTDTISFNAMQTQEYELSVLFDNNCRRTAKTIVNVDTMAIPHITGDSVICYGEQARLVAQVDSPTYVLRWGNGYEGDVLVVRPSDTSTYVVKAVLPTDEECFTTDTLVVNVKPLPEISFTYSPDEVVIERGVGTLTCFTDCDPDYNIVWNFNDRYNPETSIIEDLHSVTHDFTHVGSYDVTLSATNQYECRDSVTEHIRVYVPVSFTVPNAFTPNDDGLNDYFIPVYEGVEVVKYLMLVYDRAGRLVFKSTNPTVGWNGRDFSGQLCPQGVYTYYIHHWTQMDSLEGSGQPVISGGVTLIR